MSSHVQARKSGDARSLQERLHELIDQISYTTDIVKNWPESSGDDRSIHSKTTTKLINSIREIIDALKRVEGVCKKDEVLWSKLKECPIPLDLLDLMDCSTSAGRALSPSSGGFGLNPEMFMRGLLREALSQLAGLRRRKVALEMLGSAIETGLEKKQQSTGTKMSVKRNKSKRNRDDSDENNENELDQQPTKKERTS